MWRIGRIPSAVRLASSSRIGPAATLRPIVRVQTAAIPLRAAAPLFTTLAAPLIQRAATTAVGCCCHCAAAAQPAAATAAPFSSQSRILLAPRKPRRAQQPQQQQPLQPRPQQQTQAQHAAAQAAAKASQQTAHSSPSAAPAAAAAPPARPPSPSVATAAAPPPKLPTDPAAIATPFWGSSLAAVREDPQIMQGWRARWPLSVLIAPNPSSVPRSTAQKLQWAVLETGVLYVSMWISRGLHLVLWEAGTALLPTLVAETQSITLHSLKALSMFPISILIYAGFCSELARRFPELMQPPPALFWRSQITDCKRRGGWARFTFIGGARGRSGWGMRFLLTLAGGAVMAAIVFANQLNDTPGDESSLSAELCMDPGWATLVSTGLTIPLEEEILFRGILFARAVRFMGLAPAVLFSSALFGLVHFRSWSDTDKVVFASAAGVVFSMLTQATQTILPATVVHAVNNLCSMLYARRYTPTLDSLTLRDRLLNDFAFQWRLDMFLVGLKNLLLLYKIIMGHVRLLPRRGTNRYLKGGEDRRSAEEREEDQAAAEEVDPTPLTPEEEAALSLDLGLSPAFTPLPIDAFLEQAAEKSTRATVIGTWLCMDGSLQPAAGQLVSAVFHALDRGNKGYLSTEELAWILALQQSKFIKISSAVGIIERRVGGLDAQQEAESLQQAQQNLSTLPQDQLPPPLAYPSESFFTHAESTRAQAKLSSTLGVLGRSGVSLRLPSPSWGSFERAASIPQIPHPSVRAAPEVSAACKATQRAMLDRFTALHWRAFHLTYFHPASSAFTLRERRSYVRHIPVGESAVKEEIAPADQGCTVERFRAYVQRESILHPVKTAQWIAACVQVIQGKHAHPMQTLIEAHEAGRQGYLGRRLPTIVDDPTAAKDGIVPVHPAL